MVMSNLDQLSTNEVLALERTAAKQGTGLQAPALIGRWSPRRLWSAGAPEPNTGQAKLLQLLRAELKIAEADPHAVADLELSNAVGVGPFSLRFTGPGWLQGRRPLLLFHFEHLSLSLGRLQLLHVNLPAPKPKRSPFFALIGCSDDGWLLARGRGGGLALWQRD